MEFLLYNVQVRFEIRSLIGELQQVYIDNWYFMKRNHCVCEEKESLSVTLKKCETDVAKSCCEGTESIQSNFNNLMNKWSEHADALISKEFHDTVLNLCNELYRFKISMIIWLNMLELYLADVIIKKSFAEKIISNECI